MPYIRFTSVGVSLFTNLKFLPIYVPAMNSQTDGALRKLCVYRAFNEYETLR